MTRPRVDVGVVTWNTAELTCRGLRALLDTDQGCTLRLLVHDNASSDGTPEALAAKVPEADVEVSATNLGFAAGMNRLLARSDAPWFMVLNSDAWPDPQALATLMGVLERHPNSAAAVPALRRPDGEVEHSVHPFPAPSVALIDVLGGRRWLPRSVLDRRCLQGGWRADCPRVVEWAVGAAMLVRRAALEQIGGFDERFFMYVEDLEWCWRARRRGWQVRYEPGAVVRHVGGASANRRWGDGRVALEASYLRRFTDEALGRRRARLWRGLSAVACGERMVGARLKGRSDEFAYWRLRTKANLGLVAPPPVDAPPQLVDDQSPPSADLPPSGADLPPSGDGGATEEPTQVAVVVPTHGRAHLLPRLVAALERQTLPLSAFRVVIVDDGSTDDTGTVLERLRRSSPLRIDTVRLDVRRGPATARNRGWRSTTAPVVAFTDDDCRPEPAWLASGVDAFAGRRRVVVGRTVASNPQGSERGFTTVVEADSAEYFATCNVFYRRRDLEAIGGFDERFRRPSGEDTDAGLRATGEGVEPYFAPDVVVHHDVRRMALGGALKEAARWVDLPLVLRGHPEMRSALHRNLFWKPSHPAAIAAGVGLLAGLWWRPGVVLLAPWIVRRVRTQPRPALLWPGALLVDLFEVGTLAWGSLRHGTLVL